MIIRVIETGPFTITPGANIWINIRHPGCGIDYIIEVDSTRCIVGLGGQQYKVSWSMKQVLSALRNATEKLLSPTIEGNRLAKFFNFEVKPNGISKK
jgi:hypothetical protein